MREKIFAKEEILPSLWEIFPQESYWGCDWSQRKKEKASKKRESEKEIVNTSHSSLVVSQRENKPSEGTIKRKTNKHMVVRKEEGTTYTGKPKTYILIF